MITQDPQAPATKQDLLGTEERLRGEMGQMKDELRGEMGQMKDELRGEMGQLTQHLIGVMEHIVQGSEQRMVEHFNLVAENLRYDMLGIHTDKIQSHEDRLRDHEHRITQLERQTLVTPHS